MNNPIVFGGLILARILLLAGLIGDGLAARAKPIERQKAAYIASKTTNLRVLVGTINEPGGRSCFGMTWTIYS